MSIAIKPRWPIVLHFLIASSLCLNHLQTYAQSSPLTIKNVMERINNVALVGASSGEVILLRKNLMKQRDKVSKTDREKFDQLMESLGKHHASLKQLDRCDQLGSLKEVLHQGQTERLLRCLNGPFELQHLLDFGESTQEIVGKLEQGEIPEDVLEQMAKDLYAHQRESLLGPTLILYKRYFDADIESVEDFFDKIGEGKLEVIDEIDTPWIDSHETILKDITHLPNGISQLTEKVASRLETKNRLKSNQIRLSYADRMNDDNHFTLSRDYLLTYRPSSVAKINPLDRALILPPKKSTLPLGFSSLIDRNTQPTIMLTPSGLELVVSPVHTPIEIIDSTFFEKPVAELMYAPDPFRVNIHTDIKKTFGADNILDNRLVAESVTSFQDEMIRNLIAQGVRESPELMNQYLNSGKTELTIYDDNGNPAFTYDIIDLALEGSHRGPSDIIGQRFRVINRDGGTIPEFIDRARKVYATEVQTELPRLLGSPQIKLSDLQRIHSEAYKVTDALELTHARREVQSLLVRVRSEQEVAQAALYEGDVGRVVIGSISAEDDNGILDENVESLRKNDQRVKESLEQNIESIVELIHNLDQSFNDSPEAFIKNTIAQNPHAIANLIRKYPQYAGYLCALAKDVTIDQKKAREWNRKVTWALTAAAVILTVTAIGAPVGSLLAATAAAGGLVMSVGGAISGFKEHAQLKAEGQLTLDRYRSLGEESGLDPREAVYQARELHRQSQSALKFAVLDVALAPFDVLEISSALRNFDNISDLRKVVSSPSHFQKFVNAHRGVHASRKLKNKIDDFISLIDGPARKNLIQFRLDYGEDRFSQLIETLDKIDPTYKNQLAQMIGRYNGANKDEILKAIDDVFYQHSVDLLADRFLYSPALENLSTDELKKLSEIKSNLTRHQIEAIHEAHIYANNTGGSYSPAELREKMRRLERAFSRSEADLLIRGGIAGHTDRVGDSLAVSQTQDILSQINPGDKVHFKSAASGNQYEDLVAEGPLVTGEHGTYLPTKDANGREVRVYTHRADPHSIRFLPAGETVSPQQVERILEGVQLGDLVTFKSAASGNEYANLRVINPSAVSEAGQPYLLGRLPDGQEVRLFHHRANPLSISVTTRADQVANVLKDVRPGEILSFRSLESGTQYDNLTVISSINDSPHGPFLLGRTLEGREVRLYHHRADPTSIARGPPPTAHAPIVKDEFHLNGSYGDNRYYVRTTDGKILKEYLDNAVESSDFFSDFLKQTNARDLTIEEFTQMNNDMHRIAALGKKGNNPYNAGRYSSDQIDAGVSLNNLSMYQGEMALSSRRPAMAEYTDHVLQKTLGLDKSVSESVKVKGIPTDISPNNYLGGIHQYPQPKHIPTYFESARQQLNSIRSLPANAPATQVIDEIADYYHTMIHARPYTQINNSMFMTQVNNLLHARGLPRVTHGYLDHLAHRTDFTDFREIFRQHLAENIPIPSDLGL